MLSVDERWVRSGRGHSLEFFALDSEVIEFLKAVSALQPDFALLTFDLGDAVDATAVHPLTSLAELRQRGAWSFFLWSPTLDPDLLVALRSVDRTQRPSVCSLNGLIALQHGRKALEPATGREAVGPSQVAWVDTVASLDTGREVRHEAYRRPFAAIRRAVRRALVCTTITVTRMGRSESAQKRMTRAAAEAARRDPVFTETPGTCS